MKRVILRAINAERRRQQKKWQGFHKWGQGDCSSSFVDVTVKAAVLSEECGEVARAVLDERARDLKRELIQVAAVAVAWLEGLE